MFSEQRVVGRRSAESECGFVSSRFAQGNLAIGIECDSGDLRSAAPARSGDLRRTSTCAEHRTSGPAPKNHTVMRQFGKMFFNFSSFSFFQIVSILELSKGDFGVKIEYRGEEISDFGFWI